MNFKEANPQDETYWWAVDEDGTPTIVYIVHTENKGVRAGYMGSDEFFDATEIEYLSQITQIPLINASEPHFNDGSGGLLAEGGKNYSTKEVLNTIVSHELDREKIIFADHLIALFPPNMTQVDILKMLENAVGKVGAGGKDIKHLKDQGIIAKDANTRGSLPSFGIVDKKQRYGKKLSPAEQELHDMEADTK